MPPYSDLPPMYYDLAHQRWLIDTLRKATMAVATECGDARGPYWCERTVWEQLDVKATSALVAT